MGAFFGLHMKYDQVWLQLERRTLFTAILFAILQICTAHSCLFFNTCSSLCLETPPLISPCFTSLCPSGHYSTITYPQKPSLSINKSPALFIYFCSFIIHYAMYFTFWFHLLYAPQVESKFCDGREFYCLPSV